MGSGDIYRKERHIWKENIRLIQRKIIYGKRTHMEKIYIEKKPT